MLKNNKSKKILLALFLLAVAAGVFYPISKIISYEFPTSPPTVVRFHVTLYDPYDPFRGRYVQLRVPSQRVTVNEKREYARNNGYAVLEKDEDGFAVVVDLLDKPEPGKTAMRIQSIWRSYYDDTAGHTYEVSFPLDRFYMNEKLAPEAERVVAEAIKAGGAGCALLVNVYANGNSTIKDLLIGDTPIHEFLKKDMAERKQ